MKKPQPPKPAWEPTTPTQQTSQHQPIASPMRIEDSSPLVEPLDPPVYAASSTDKGVLCESCKNCWTLDVAGNFKNKKADGTDYVLTERFCVFKEIQGLITLAERAVLECNRYEQRNDK